MKLFTEADEQISLKVSSMTKSKRIGKLPKTFEELRVTVENLIAEERPVFACKEFANAKKDYVIRYQDRDQDVINVSDDDDLQTAYQVAKTELNGVLKLKIDFKTPLKMPLPASEQTTFIPKQTEEESRLKEEKAAFKAAEKVVQKAEKKALKEEKKKSKEHKKKRSMLVRASVSDKMFQQCHPIENVADRLKARIGQITQALGTIVSARSHRVNQVPEESSSIIDQA